MTQFTKYLYPLFFLFLAACSSSSGDGSGGEDLGTSITEDEFIQNMSTGVYRISTEMTLPEIKQTFTIGSDTVTVTITGSAQAEQAISLTVNSATSATYDACDLEGPVISNLADEVVDPGVPGATSCTQQYFRVSDTHLRIKYSCSVSGTQTDFILDANRLSDDPVFNLGALSLVFGSASYADTDRNSGVCGSMVSSASVTTVTPDVPGIASTMNETSIDLVAPYVNGNRVMLELAFSTDNLVAGSYDVADSLSFVSAKEVTLTVLSAEFGGTPTSPGSISATGGKVTVDSVTSRSISGSYSVVVGGDTLSGNFSLNLQ